MIEEESIAELLTAHQLPAIVSLFLVLEGVSRRLIDHSLFGWQFQYPEKGP
jgi:hypothetical protein